MNIIFRFNKIIMKKNNSNNSNGDQFDYENRNEYGNFVKKRNTAKNKIEFRSELLKVLPNLDFEFITIE